MSTDPNNASANRTAKRPKTGQEYSYSSTQAPGARPTQSKYPGAAPVHQGGGVYPVSGNHSTGTYPGSSGHQGEFRHPPTELPPSSMPLPNSKKSNKMTGSEYEFVSPRSLLAVQPTHSCIRNTGARRAREEAWCSRTRS
jgi:hypothetical protein